jgi:hypothetical protein
MLNPTVKTYFLKLTLQEIHEINAQWGYNISLSFLMFYRSYYIDVTYFHKKIHVFLSCGTIFILITSDHYKPLIYKKNNSNVTIQEMEDVSLYKSIIHLTTLQNYE